MFVDGKNKSEMYFRELQWEVVDWVHLVQNRDKWLAVVSTVMNIWVFILLSEQHKFVDFVDWFLFSSATCFGCLCKPSSGGSQKEQSGERPPFTNSGYSIMVKFYDYYSENWIISDIFLFSDNNYKVSRSLRKSTFTNQNTALWLCLYCRAHTIRFTSRSLQHRACSCYTSHVCNEMLFLFFSSFFMPNKYAV